MRKRSKKPIFLADLDDGVCECPKCKTRIKPVGVLIDNHREGMPRWFLGK